MIVHSYLAFLLSTFEPSESSDQELGTESKDTCGELSRVFYIAAGESLEVDLTEKIWRCGGKAAYQIESYPDLPSASLSKDTTKVFFHPKQADVGQYEVRFVTISECTPYEPSFFDFTLVVVPQAQDKRDTCFDLAESSLEELRQSSSCDPSIEELSNIAISSGVITNGAISGAHAPSSAAIPSLEDPNGAEETTITLPPGTENEPTHRYPDAEIHFKHTDLKNQIRYDIKESYLRLKPKEAFSYRVDSCRGGKLISGPGNSHFDSERGVLHWSTDDTDYHNYEFSLVCPQYRRPKACPDDVGRLEFLNVSVVRENEGYHASNTVYMRANELSQRSLGISGNYVRSYELPPGAIIEPIGHTIIWHPSEEDIGIHSLALQTDQKGRRSSYEIVDIIVLPPRPKNRRQCGPSVGYGGVECLGRQDLLRQNQRLLRRAEQKRQIQQARKNFLVPGAGYTTGIPLEQNALIQHGLRLELSFVRLMNQKVNWWFISSRQATANFYLVAEGFFQAEQVNPHPVLAFYGIGINRSFERSQLRRHFVPFVGMDLGAVHGRGQELRFAAKPYLGLYLWADPRFMISLQAGGRIVAQKAAKNSVVTAGLSFQFSPWAHKKYR